MAMFGVQIVAQFTAWDTSANAPKTGDAANFTLEWVKDGTAATPTNVPAVEISSANAPGEYKITMTATEAQALSGTICGKSSTANIVLIPKTYTFDQIPNATPGAAGGLFIAGTNAATTITTGLTAHIIGTVDTLTTYTGNTPQTGDAYARVGLAGVGLTNLGDTRIANLDAAVSSRMATYSQPTGFLAATFPTGTVANTTNITAGTITTTTNLTNAPTAGDFTATMKTSLNAATPVATLSGDFSATMKTSLNAATPVVTLSGDFSATMKTSLNAATPSVTVSDKTGFSLSATGSAALTESYSADGATATLPQLLYGIKALLGEFSIAGTTLTTKKLDGASTAEIYTLNDGTSPTAVTRTG